MSDLFHEVELALVEVFLTELGSKLKISKFKTSSKLCYKCSYIVCQSVALQKMFTMEFQCALATSLLVMKCVLTIGKERLSENE